MAISFSGLNSGLDTSSWIKSLTALKQAKVTTLQQQQEKLQTSLQALNGIKSYFSTFRSMITKVTDAKFNIASMDIFSKHVTTSSNVNVLTAAASADAVEGTYNIKVDQLATNTEASSSVKTKTSTTVSKTTTEDTYLKDLGIKAGVIDVAPDDTGITVRLNITESETVGSFINKLKNIGVNASFNEQTAVFNVNIDTTSINDVGRTGIIDGLKLTGVNKGYDTNNLTYDNVVTTSVYADGSTKLSDIGVSAGTITIQTNDSIYSLELEDGDTIQDLIDALGSEGIEASINNGIFRIENAHITDDGTTNLIDVFGLNNPVMAGNTQMSERLKYTTVINSTTDADGNTTFGNLGVSGGIVTVRKDGVDYEFTISQENTLQSFIDEMNSKGISAAITDGVFTIDDAEIVNDGTTGLIDAFSLNRPDVDSVQQKSGVLKYTTVISTTTTADGTVELGTWGVSDGNLVVSSNGETFTISVTSSMTIDELIGAFKANNLEASYADGVLDLGDVKILSTSTTNLVSKLGISESEVSYILQESNVLNYSSTVTNTVRATETTALKEFGVKNGTITVETYDNNGNIQQNQISISENMTFQQLINEFRAINSSASLQDGVLVLPNANITDEGTTGIKSALGISDTSEASNLQKSDALQYTTVEVKTTTVSATTTLDYLGISNGNIVLSDKSSTYTISVSSTDTLGDFIDRVNAIDGFTAALNNGDITLSGMNIDSDGSTNLINALGLTQSSQSAIGHYQSSSPVKYQTTEVSTTTADAATTLAEIASAMGTSVNSGNIVVNDATHAVTISISTTDTVSSLLNKFSAAGLVGVNADITDGVITISGINITDEGGTNIIDLLGLAPTSEGVMHMWSNSLTYHSVTETTTLVDMTTVIGDWAANNGATLTDGGVITLSDIEGNVRSVTVSLDKTFGDLVGKLSAAAGSNASITFENGKLQMSGVNIVSDTSGLLSAIGNRETSLAEIRQVTSDLIYTVTTTTSVTATEDTTIAELIGYEMTGNSEIGFIDDNTAGDVWITITPDMTIAGLVSLINNNETSIGLGFSANFSNGVLTVNGAESIAPNVQQQGQDIISALDMHFVVTSLEQRSNDLTVNTQTTVTVTATGSTKISDLLLDTTYNLGALWAVDTSNCNNKSTPLTNIANATIDDLITMLNTVGEASFTDGVLTMTGVAFNAESHLNEAFGMDVYYDMYTDWSHNSMLANYLRNYNQTVFDPTTEPLNIEDIYVNDIGLYLPMGGNMTIAELFATVCSVNTCIDDIWVEYDTELGTRIHYVATDGIAAKDAIQEAQNGDALDFISAFGYWDVNSSYSIMASPTLKFTSSTEGIKYRATYTATAATTFADLGFNDTDNIATLEVWDEVGQEYRTFTYASTKTLDYMLIEISNDVQISLGINNGIITDDGYGFGCITGGSIATRLGITANSITGDTTLADLGFNDTDNVATAGTGTYTQTFSSTSTLDSVFSSGFFMYTCSLGYSIENGQVSLYKSGNRGSGKVTGGSLIDYFGFLDDDDYVKYTKSTAQIKYTQTTTVTATSTITTTTPTTATGSTKLINLAFCNGSSISITVGATLTIDELIESGGPSVIGGGTTNTGGPMTTIGTVNTGGTIQKPITSIKDLGSITVTSTMTLNDLCTKLSDITGKSWTVSNGTIKYVSTTTSRYSYSGTLATALGLGGKSSGTLQIATTATTTTTTTTTSTSTITATGDTALSSIYSGISNVKLVLADKNYHQANPIYRTITLNGTQTVNDLITTLSEYGIDAKIENGYFSYRTLSGKYLVVGANLPSQRFMNKLNLSTPIDCLDLEPEGAISTSGFKTVGDPCNNPTDTITYTETLPVSPANPMARYWVNSDGLTFQEFRAAHGHTGATALVINGSNILSIIDVINSSSATLEDMLRQRASFLGMTLISDTTTGTLKFVFSSDSDIEISGVFAEWLNMTSNHKMTSTGDTFQSTQLSARSILVTTTITSNTTLGDVYLGNDSVTADNIYIHKNDGSRATISVDSTTTFGNLKNELLTYGLLLNWNSNTFSVTSTSDTYIDAAQTGEAASSFYSILYDMFKSGYMQSSILTLEDNVTTNTYNANWNTKLSDLGVTDCEFIILDSEAGVDSQVVTVTASMTLQQVGELMGTWNESEQAYIGTSADGSTMWKLYFDGSKLRFDTAEEYFSSGYNVTLDSVSGESNFADLFNTYVVYDYTSNSQSIVTSDGGADYNADENTLLGALNVTNGSVYIQDVNGQNISTFTVSSTSKLSDFLSWAQTNGITVNMEQTASGTKLSYDSDSFKFADGTSNLSAILFSNRYTTNEYVSSQPIEKLYTQTVTYNASLDTKLGSSSETDSNGLTTTSNGLGCTGGNYVVVKDGVRHTLSIASTQTLNDVNAQIAEYGLQITTEETATGTKFIINSNTDAYLASADGAGASDFVQRLFGNSKTTIYGYGVHKDIEYEQAVNKNMTGDSLLIGQSTYTINNPDGTTSVTTLGATSVNITEGIYDIVRSDGTRITQTITASTTVNDFLANLRSAGFTAELITEDGVSKIRVKGTGGQYIDNSTQSGTKSNVVAALFSNTRHTTYNYSSELYNTNNEDITYDIDNSTELSKLGITTGRFNIISNGRTVTAQVTEGMTFGDLKSLLDGYGINMNLVRGEDGVRLVLDANSNSKVEAATGVDASNLVSKIGLVTKQVQYDYSSNNLSVTTSVENTIAATGSMLLSDFGITSGQYYIVKDGVKSALNISSDETFDSFIRTLNSYGITAALVEKSDGVHFEVNTTGNSYLEKATGSNASNVVDKLANNTIKIYDYSSELKVSESDPTTIEATDTSLLSDYGITSGEYYIYSNGVRITANISNDETFASLTETLAQFGLRGSLIKTEDGIRYVVNGDGASYIAKSNSARASNLLDKIFTNGSTVMYNYESKISIENTVTDKVAATEDTLLSQFDTSTLKAQGRLALVIDGKSAYIDITADDTFGTLIDKFAKLGISATLSPEGKFVINSGFGDVSINTSATTSKLMTTIGLSENNNLGGFASSSSSLIYNETIVSDNTLSVANYADLSTQMGMLNITSGMLSIYRNGTKANVQVNKDETFAQLRKRINDAFAQGDVDIRFNNGNLEIFSTTDGVKVEAGTTTDTSNLYAICGLTSNGNSVMSSRELYKVNGSSAITTAGLFREGNVTEGTFTIGGATFTIDSDTTLNNIISMINSSDKSNATAYWDSVEGKLVLKSRTAGYSLINIEAGTSNFTDIMGLTATERNAEGTILSARLLSESQQMGSNAVFEINGTRYTSTSNHIESDVSRLTGITLDLKGVSLGEEVTITIERDKESVANAVSDIVDAYNELLTNVDTELAKTGNLNNQSALKMIRNQLRSLMTSSIANAGAFRNLSQIGIGVSSASAGNISTDSINALSFDAEKFMDSFSADTDSVKALLVGTDEYNGIFMSIDNILENALGSVTGYFDTAANSYTTQIQALTDKITKANAAVERYRERLEAKFGSMDMLIGQMQQQYQSFLS